MSKDNATRAFTRTRDETNKKLKSEICCPDASNYGRREYDEYVGAVLVID
jgi:hypothetical protein